MFIWQMHVMVADGTRLLPLWSDVDVRGTASWSPDGKWIVAAGSDREGAGLFKLPVDGGVPVQIVRGPFLDPVWSPRGDLIVYCGTQVCTRTPPIKSPYRTSLGQRFHLQGFGVNRALTTLGN